MANGIYNQGLEEFAKALTDLSTDDIRVLLVQSTYTFDPTHSFIDNGDANDPQSHEVSVSGYARVALTTETVTRNDTDDYVSFTADDITFATLAAGQTVGGMVVFRHTGTDTTAPLLAFFDLANTPTDGGDLDIVGELLRLKQGVL